MSSPVPAKDRTGAKSIPREKVASARARAEPSPLDDKVKVKRPAIFTRPSNDYITNLMRLNSGNATTESLPTPPEMSRQGSQLSVQQNERRPMTASYPKKNTWRIVGACLWSFAGGFSDAAPGALLPTIEAHYHVSYSIVSLIWMSNAVGFILVAVFSNKIQPWFGREKSLPLGCLCSVIMYAMVASGGPFPLIVSGFFFGGIGLAVVLAQVNIFLTKLEKNSKYLAFFHGSYGLGATISPFVATTLIEHDVSWNYTYIIMLGLMVFNLVNLYFAYKGADHDLLEWEHDEEAERLLTKPGPRGIDSGTHTPAEREDGVGLQDLGTHLTAAFDNETIKKSSADHGAMLMALKSRLTWNISMFVFLYQGCEVSLGGWIVSYLVDYRHTTTSYGYVSSGFWGGLTIGRLALTRPLHKYVGARRSISVLVAATMAMVLLTWFVPSDIVSSVCVSVAGVLIGPIYPLMIANVSQMLPRKIQMIGLTIMTAFGSSGGAVLPFLVGLVAQTSGTYVVLPICVAGYVVMMVLWLMLPNIEWTGDTPRTWAQKVRYVLW